MSAVPLAALGTRPLAGQEASRAVPIEILERAYHNNWHVRAVMLDQDTLLGRVRGARDRYRIDNFPIQPAEVLSLDRRRTSGSGALAGALVGAIVLGAIGAGSGGMGDVAPGNNDLLVVGALGGIGGIIGLFAGKAIRPGVTDWVPLWPSTLDQR